MSTRRAPSPLDAVICIYCGRRGTRGFSAAHSRDKDFVDQWRCESATACERRQVVSARPTLRSLQGEAERIARKIATDRLPPDAGAIGMLLDLVRRAWEAKP